ncbi:MAG: flagellar basal body rod protein FlgC [Bdellovibrionales bacterium]|nr:flagellar basal body rod protein FlgC [Bdellovibrionales bacterium]
MFHNIFNIAAEAMSANRLRINTIASNVANAQTTRTEEGGPYKRRDVVFAATDVANDPFASQLDRATLKGVRVAGVVADDSPPRMVYDPGHPDANPETGIVEMPNISPVTEMANLLSASAAYKAAAEVVNISKSMAQVLRRLSQRF